MTLTRVASTRWLTNGKRIDYTPPAVCSSLSSSIAILRQQRMNEASNLFIIGQCFSWHFHTEWTQRDESLLERSFLLVLKSTRTRIYTCTQAIIRGNHRCLSSSRSSLPSSLLFQYWFNFRLFNLHISSSSPSSCGSLSVWVKWFWFKDQQSLFHHFSSHCYQCFFIISFQSLLIHIHTCVYIDCLYKNKRKGWRESACCY
jgi:hypothetical protein